MNRLQEKLHKLRERWKQTRGAIIMEATIVYPVMFFVIFFMLFMGNMFCIRAGIDSLVTQEALTGAAYYADPKLESYSEKEKIPTTLSEAGHVTKNLYRYLDIFDIGGSQSVQSTNLKENIGSYTGYFTGMNPDRIEIVSHKVNNYIIYQTYEVEVKYYLNFPWKFIFHDEKYDIAMTARAEVPVTDSAEFIRNVDLAVDILERTEKGETASENINKTFEKVTAFLNGESRNGGPVTGGIAITELSDEELQAVADKAAQDYNASRKGYEKALEKGYIGVEKTPNGGPSFANSEYIYKKDGNKMIVTIKATGSRSQDFAQADKYIKEKYGIESRPDGYTWHHLDDYNVAENEITMELVLTDAHKASYPHSGGCAQYKAVTGKTYK